MLDGREWSLRSNSLLRLIVVVVVGMLMGALSGCAVKLNPLTLAGSVESTTSSSGGSTSTTTTTAPAPPKATSGIAAVMNFGDSITCGYYALPNDGAGYMYSNAGYATRLDTQLGGVAKDLCRGGDMAADMARLWVYPNTDPALGSGQLYTVLIGTNDAHFCGGDAGCLANWSGALAASLAWLSLPSTDKVLGSSMIAQGAWSSDLEFGESTTQAGASLSFKVTQAVGGRALHIGYRVFDALVSGGSATVSVDGVPVATLHANVETGHAIATQNGGTDTVFSASVPLGAVGEHSVTISTSAAGGVFSVLWAGVSSQNYASLKGAPLVLVGQLTPTGNDDLNAVVGLYNAALAPLVAGLVVEGMNVVVAPTAKAFDPATEMADLLHPNNVGHAKLAAVFAAALPVVD